MYEEIKEIYPEKELYRAEDLSGKIFGNWKVLYRTDNVGDNTMWICECMCDKHTIKPVSTKSLKSGMSMSCGCERVNKCNETKDKRLRIRNDNGDILYKQCFRCKRMLPISNFYKCKSNFDGYSSECNQCQHESKENRYNIYKKNAKKRNIEFHLSKEEFYSITSKPCNYCGGYSRVDLNGDAYNGVDRIDSNKDYTIDNVVPCCDVCNKMKLDYSTDFFLNHINKIIKHMKEVV